MNRLIAVLLVGILIALVSIARDLHHLTLIHAAYIPAIVKTTGNIPLSDDEKRILELDTGHR